MEHRLITGGEVYLPFARSRVKALQATGLAYASQSYEIDGVSINVRIEPGQAFIRINSGSVPYEFFCTGATLATAALGAEVVNLGYAVAGKRSGGKLLGSARGSTAEQAASGAAKQWKYSANGLDMDHFMPHRDVWQLQGIPEHQYFPAAAASPFLVSSWGASSAHTNLLRRSGYFKPWHHYDVQYDVAPSIFTGTKTTPQALAPDADWYRRAALRKVTSAQFGDRWFVILSDVANRFYAYPVGSPDAASIASAAAGVYAAQSIKTNVQAAVTRSQAAPLPAWVRQPDAQSSRDYWQANPPKAPDYTLHYPQYLWSFNSAATRACAVVYRDLATTYFTSGPFAGTTPSMMVGGLATPLVEALPGMVELDLALAVTGPLPGDFTFDVTLRDAIDPVAQDQYVLAVGYAWKVPGATALDDLIVLSGDRYYESAFTPSTSNNFLITSSVTNRTTGAAIRSFTASMGYNAAGAVPRYFVGSLLLAFDLRILAFAVQYDAQKAEISPLRNTRASRLVVIAHNAVAQTQEMTADVQMLGFLDTAQLAPSLAGMTRYSPNASASAASSEWYAGYLRAEDYYSNDSAAYRTAALASLSLVLPAGALQYALDFGEYLTGANTEAFSVHPEGHWSVVTGPTFFYNGVVRDPFSHTNLPLDTLIDPALMVQDFLDVVSIRKTAADGTVTDTRTSHIALFNQAYGKALLKSDFFFGLDLVVYEVAMDSVPTRTRRLHYVRVSDPGRPAGAAFWLLYELESTVAVPAFTLLRAYNLALMDARTNSGLVFTDRLLSAAPGGGYAATRSGPSVLRMARPILRGASLFGSIKKASA